MSRVTALTLNEIPFSKVIIFCSGESLSVGILVITFPLLSTLLNPLRSLATVSSINSPFCKVNKLIQFNEYNAVVFIFEPSDLPGSLILELFRVTSVDL